MLGGRGPGSSDIATCRQLSQQGKSAVDRNDWLTAETLFAQAIKANPDDATARQCYAEALWKRGAQIEALAQAEEAMRLAGDDATIIVQLGEMNLALGRVDEAGRLANAALDAHPQDAGAWTLRAHVLARESQLDKSLADLHRALEHSPGDRQLLMELAEQYRATNRPQRALATLTALRETYPQRDEPARVLYLQGLAMVAMGRHSDAADAYAAAIEREGPSADLLAALADAQFRSGNTEAAERSVQQALALNPGHAASRALVEQIVGVRTAAVPRE
jgi:tetratricopeptide (TPR) repeat protein